MFRGGAIVQKGVWEAFSTRVVIACVARLAGVMARLTRQDGGHLGGIIVVFGVGDHVEAKGAAVHAGVVEEVVTFHTNCRNKEKRINFSKLAKKTV